MLCWNTTQTFVEAIHILLKHSSTLSEVEKAEILLFSFVKDFACYYTTSFMTLNIHHLDNLADSIR